MDVHHIRRICLIKTLLVKNPWEKPSEGKIVQYSLNCSWHVRVASLKTLPVKPSETKPEWKEKEYSTLTLFYKHTPLHVDILELKHSNLVYLLFECWGWQWLNINFTILLEFMCIKEFWWNMFSSILFNITPCYLCNARNIVFK